MPRPRLDDILYLCPALKTLEGPPLEHVLMMRDEMANMVWGIEKTRAGHLGRAAGSQVREQPPVDDSGAAPAGRRSRRAGGAPLNYRLQTPVAGALDPVPAGQEGRRDTVQLVDPAAARRRRRTTTRSTPLRLNDPRNADYKAFIERLRAAPFVEQKPEQGRPTTAAGLHVPPARRAFCGWTRTRRSSTDYLRVEEEEVPRDGIELKRAFNYARDAQGRALLWIGRSKTPVAARARAACAST